MPPLWAAVRIRKVTVGRTPGLAWVPDGDPPRAFVAVPCTQNRRPFMTSLPTTSYITHPTQEAKEARCPSPPTSPEQVPLLLLSTFNQQEPGPPGKRRRHLIPSSIPGTSWLPWRPPCSFCPWSSHYTGGKTETEEIELV